MTLNRRIKIVMINLILLLTACSIEQKPEGIVKHSSIFQEAEVTRIMVVEEGAPVYSDINIALSPLYHVPEKAVFQVVGKTEDWYIILLQDNEIGCIKKSTVVPYIEGKDISSNSVLKESLSSQEAMMLSLINEARSKAGLKPLKLDLRLCQLARLKSQDLIQYNYFSHYSPSFGNPFEMLSQHNISYVFAGENLAGNRDVKKAHQELMNSDTHRQNILHPAFTHVGIGAVKGGPYGYIYTQLYIGI